MHEYFEEMCVSISSVERKVLIIPGLCSDWINITTKRLPGSLFVLSHILLLTSLQHRSPHWPRTLSRLLR